MPGRDVNGSALDTCLSATGSRRCEGNCNEAWGKRKEQALSPSSRQDRLAGRQDEARLCQKTLRFC